MTTIATPSSLAGTLEVFVFAHPQGCRSYLVCEPASRQAMAIDPHLDSIGEIGEVIDAGGWTLPYVVDTHTHADHPSGAAALAKRFGSTRMAHAAAKHAGVTRHPEDGSTIHLGDTPLHVRHAPGHTPDHIVLWTDRVLFSGDTLMIGGVARTDFLGGDAGQLFDSIHEILEPLGDEVVVYPGHDYEGRTDSTVGQERANNPWLRISDRAEFVRALTANPPPRPANMDALLKLNRDGDSIPSSMPASDAIARVGDGGAVSLIDIRTPFEIQQEHVDGARRIPLEEIGSRVDEIRAVPAPRMLLCRSGKRAELAREQLSALGVAGLTVVEGGIQVYADAGGRTLKASAGMSLERQVRIAAGMLVVLGAGLGLLVHPGFHALALFVGAGLVFAGVTDRCGMALVLTKLPWNRVAEESTPFSPGIAGTCAAQPPSAVGTCAAQPPKS